MECGHGGLCFQCGIALCTNTYEKNVKMARKHLERSQSARSNLKLLDANCHICRQHITSVFQLDLEHSSHFEGTPGKNLPQG